MNGAIRVRFRMRAASGAGESGQAAAESALTLPLTVFLVLGTLQVFMMLQARIIAQYAVYKAVRAGSLNSGNCANMKQAAIAALLPTITATDTLARFGAAYQARNGNRYNAALDGGHSGPIVEIVREQPAAVPAPEAFNFDQPSTSAQMQRLEIRMIYWYRLKVPFADWVLERMFLAHFGIQAYAKDNPLMPAMRNANWTGTATLADEGDWPAGPLAQNMSNWAGAEHFLFPIKVSSVMRMMTPPASRFFGSAACPVP